MHSTTSPGKPERDSPRGPTLPKQGIVRKNLSEGSPDEVMKCGAKMVTFLVTKQGFAQESHNALESHSKKVRRRESSTMMTVAAAAAWPMRRESCGDAMCEKEKSLPLLQGAG